MILRQSDAALQKVVEQAKKNQDIREAKLKIRLSDLIRSNTLTHQGAHMLIESVFKHNGSTKVVDELRFMLQDGQ